MADRRPGLPDAGLAFLIGAITGVGAVLLLRPPDDETERVIRALRGHGVKARRASERASRELAGIVRIAGRIRTGSD
jgi:hypothetical protein